MNFRNTFALSALLSVVGISIAAQAAQDTKNEPAVIALKGLLFAEGDGESYSVQGQTDGSAPCTWEARQTRFGVYLTLSATQADGTERKVSFAVSKSSQVSRDYESHTKGGERAVLQASQVRVDRDEWGTSYDRQSLKLAYEGVGQIRSVTISNTVTSKSDSNGNPIFDETKTRTLSCDAQN